MKTRILTLLLSVFIISFTSCEEEEPNPVVTLSIEHVGYSYVDFNVQLMDVWVGGSHPGATFYYDTINTLTEDSPSQSKGFEGDDFTLTLVGLEMGKEYYVKVVAEGVSSSVKRVITNEIDISCNVDKGYLRGDNSVSRQWNSYPWWNGATYLEEVDHDHLSSNLEGDFIELEIIMPVVGWYFEGVYTTYNELYENGIKASQGTSTIRLTDSDGITYLADAGQVFEYSLASGWSTDFLVEFCDMRFVNQGGHTVTLSAKLEGRF